MRKVGGGENPEVEEADGEAVNERRPEFLQEVEGQRRPAIVEPVIEADVGIKSDTVEKRLKLIAHQHVAEGEERVDGISGRSPLPAVEAEMGRYAGGEGPEIRGGCAALQPSESVERWARIEPVQDLFDLIYLAEGQGFRMVGTEPFQHGNGIADLAAHDALGKSEAVFLRAFQLVLPHAEHDVARLGGRELPPQLAGAGEQCQLDAVLEQFDGGLGRRCWPICF